MRSLSVACSAAVVAVVAAVSALRSSLLVRRCRRRARALPVRAPRGPRRRLGRSRRASRGPGVAGRVPLPREWPRPPRRIRGGRRSGAQEDLPALLDDLARSLRSGAGLRQAIAEAAGDAVGVGARSDLARVDERIRAGVPVVDALQSWARERPVPAVKLAVAGIELAVTNGGRLAGAVEHLALLVRRRLAVLGDVRLHSTQARLSALVVGLAPLGFAAFVAAGNDAVAHVLLASPLGWACIVGGLLLDALGAWWMHRLLTAARQVR